MLISQMESRKTRLYLAENLHYLKKENKKKQKHIMQYSFPTTFIRINQYHISHFDVVQKATLVHLIKYCTF